MCDSILISDAHMFLDLYMETLATKLNMRVSVVE